MAGKITIKHYNLNMWYFISPNTGKFIEIEDYIIELSKESLRCINKLKLVYEKLEYMQQKDKAFLFLADYFNFEYPDRLFTFSYDQLSGISNKKSYDIYDNENNVNDYIGKINDFLDNIADKIQYRTSYISNKDNEIIFTNERKGWNKFTPPILIKDQYDSWFFLLNNNKKLKTNPSEDCHVIDAAKSIYQGLSVGLYEEQLKLAKTIFKKIDESDKDGLRNTYNHLRNFFLNENYILDYILKKSEIYKNILKIFPLFDADIELLLNRGLVNENKPYITINKDYTLKWERNKSTFANFCVIISNKKDKNGKKRMDWKPVKDLFPQFKNVKLENHVDFNDYDTYELLAKSFSFIDKYRKKDLIKEINEGYINHVKNINKKIHSKYPLIELIS